MRKLGFFVVLLLVLAMSTSVFAKTKFAQRGTMALSGGVSLSIDSEKEDVDKAEWFTTTTLMLAPSFGYFVIDGLLVGATPIIGIMSPEEGDNVYAYGFGPTVAYYAKLMGTMFLGGGVDLFYLGSSSSHEVSEDGISGDTTKSTTGYGLKLFGGPTLAFGNKFGGFVSLYAFFEYIAETEENEFKGSAGSSTSESDKSYANIGVMSNIGIFF